MKRLLFAGMAAGILLPAIALGYPNGTASYVTDAAPFCASCHSSVKADYMPELPPDIAKKETPEGKHYFLVKLPSMPSPYIELSDKEKDKIISTARLIDSRSSISLSAPMVVRAGGELRVTLKAKGGNGPVIGAMLVDKALRFQSRPVSSDGWEIMGEPLVLGQDGKPQKTWLDKRIKGLGKNLNFIMVFDQRFDAEKEVFPEATVTYTLKAPSRTGNYTIAGAFLYGTENTDKAGFFQRPSGRILFSDELTVRVE